MGNITYSVVGAGNSRSNPVEISIGCTSVFTVCWIGKTNYTEECYGDMCTTDIYCQTVNSSVTEGLVMWNTPNGQQIPVYYTVTRDCQPDPEPLSCETKCSDLQTYTVPSSVDKSYPSSGSVNIYYQYILTCENENGYIGSRVKKSGVNSVPISDFTPEPADSPAKYTLDFKIPEYEAQCFSKVEVPINYDSTCEVGSYINLSVWTVPSIIPGLPESGTSVSVYIQFKKTIVDTGCKKRVTTGMLSFPWLVSCSLDDLQCCKGHTESSAMTYSEISAKTGADDNTKIYYNDVLLEPSDNVPYSVFMKGKDTEECSQQYDEKITYCVYSSTIQVYYETQYQSNDWTLNGVVPYGGGRIKVVWEYDIYHDIESAGISYVTSGNTYEEIIDVASCEGECDTDECQWEGVILFKEQHQSCNTCDSEEVSGVPYNKIEYVYQQKGITCIPVTTTEYNFVHKLLDECYTGSVELRIPYTSTTIYTGECQKPTETVEGEETATCFVSTPNIAPDKKTICFVEDKYLVEQRGGCQEPSDVCDKLILETDNCNNYILTLEDDNS